jgi:hypothetical protein
MAGEGRRFVEAGYSVPKPLIPIDGVPMVVRAATCLPRADEWIFICRESHVRGAGIDVTLRECFDNAAILTVDHLTEGQACTCLLARGLLQPEDSLTIGACDNSMTYDRAALETLMDAENVDAMIWTFRRNPAVLQNPRMYGWVLTGGPKQARRVSCKIPISDSPLEDHAIIGTFTFRRAGDFLACADAMIAAGRRINGEYYVDEVANVAIESGLRVMVFEVQRYICWGTPQDVDVYNYWRSYFEQCGQKRCGAVGSGIEQRDFT